MSEFTKILVTALSSFAVAIVGAILVEPLRSYVTQYFEGKTLRRNLYIELAAFHKRLSGAAKRVETKGYKLEAGYLRGFTFDTYKYAKTRPHVFYSLPDATRFDHVYGLFQFALKSLTDEKELLRTADAFVTSIDVAMSCGEFNDDLFRDVYPEYTDYLAQKKLTEALASSKQNDTTVTQ